MFAYSLDHLGEVVPGMSQLPRNRSKMMRVRGARKRLSAGSSLVVHRSERFRFTQVSPFYLQGFVANLGIDFAHLIFLEIPKFC